MSSLQQNYFRMTDGTLKMINPFTGTEVWCPPGRGNRPVYTASSKKDKKELAPMEVEDYCNFCPSKYKNTPPEKARLIIDKGGKVKFSRHLPPKEIFGTYADFRRIPNLFEIVTYEYWKQNFNFEISPAVKQWRDGYLAAEGGLDHVLNMVNLKMKLSGQSEEQIKTKPVEEKLQIADAFFGGCHEVIVAGRHYRPGAKFDDALTSSGDLTPEEHYHFFDFTIRAVKDIQEHNRYARYVSVFQNWLGPAGASFEHLHKQLVAIDEWGSSLEREVAMIRTNPNIYNEKGVNLIGYHNLVIAENDHAIAYADIGHRFATIAISSKSRNNRPMDQTTEEVRGMSDMVHACHAALGTGVPCNEEWYYAPVDCIEKMPWHILIKLRTNTPAGFEGGTKIYIQPIGPEALRDMVVPRLFELKNEGRIGKFLIAFECKCQPNALKYYLG